MLSLSILLVVLAFCVAEGTKCGGMKRSWSSRKIARRLTARHSSVPRELKAVDDLDCLSRQKRQRIASLLIASLAKRSESSSVRETMPRVRISAKKDMIARKQPNKRAACKRLFRNFRKSVKRLISNDVLDRCTKGSLARCKKTLKKILQRRLAKSKSLRKKWKRFSRRAKQWKCVAYWTNSKWTSVFSRIKPSFWFSLIKRQRRRRVVKIQPCKEAVRTLLTVAQRDVRRACLTGGECRNGTFKVRKWSKLWKRVLRRCGNRRSVSFRERHPLRVSPLSNRTASTSAGDNDRSATVNLPIWALVLLCIAIFILVCLLVVYYRANEKNKANRL